MKICGHEGNEINKKFMLDYLFENFSGTPWLGGTGTFAKTMGKLMDS